MTTAGSNVVHRHTLSQILSEFFKFAVGSAIDGSRKIIPGRKHADKMVPEGLINIPISTPLKTKKQLDKKVANELNFETKVEEVMKEDMNIIKQQYKTSTKLVENSQPPKKMDDGFKGIDLLQKNGKRVFIRSRL
ncbi:uncharacterized protein [Cicer arietinum]|uniref:Uncharacterized protein LOC101513543 n=1 Tax=Cicer arietinum TaxID=3827 RepID=A0A1S2YU31_CICAR|nr:uncharacterized protein LOC101513543 [Cicer arietinum]